MGQKPLLLLAGQADRNGTCDKGNAGGVNLIKQFVKFDLPAWKHVSTEFPTKCEVRVPM
jgi:hypothetical protein